MDKEQQLFNAANLKYMSAMMDKPFCRKTMEEAYILVKDAAEKAQKAKRKYASSFYRHAANIALELDNTADAKIMVKIGLPLAIYDYEKEEFQKLQDKINEPR